MNILCPNEQNILRKGRVSHDMTKENMTAEMLDKLPILLNDHSRFGEKLRLCDFPSVPPMTS